MNTYKIEILSTLFFFILLFAFSCKEDKIVMKSDNLNYRQVLVSKVDTNKTISNIGQKENQFQLAPGSKAFKSLNFGMTHEIHKFLHQSRSKINLDEDKRYRDSIHSSSNSYKLTKKFSFLL
jgi:hypothetical protein